MSAIALLMGLLVLSYIGSLLVGSGKARGLASGVEYVGLGFAVGPHALGLVGAPMIVDFEPIVQVILGWLAFVVGLDFGRVDSAGEPQTENDPFLCRFLLAHPLIERDGPATLRQGRDVLRDRGDVGAAASGPELVR